MLVTSRERLRVRGEQTWPVPPLARNDAAELFTARAHAVDPSFSPSEAVAELCARLDELPLAIELAAARTALFSPEQLLERLSQRLDLLKGDRDADPRQQTLRATIEWSHDLLSNEEQQLFRRLSVFVGGCTYDTAEQIADAEPDTLQSLARQEPPAQTRRPGRRPPLLDAGDDPRVRSRASSRSRARPRSSSAATPSDSSNSLSRRHPTSRTKRSGAAGSGTICWSATLTTSVALSTS